MNGTTIRISLFGKSCAVATGIMPADTNTANAINSAFMRSPPGPKVDKRVSPGHIIPARSVGSRAARPVDVGAAEAPNMAARQMKLGLFVRPCGHHIASWRHPLCQADAGVNFPHFVEMAQTAERGLFDMLFSADSATVWTAAESAIDRVHYVAWMEPFTLLSALSGYTEKIGLVCTASTSFEQPYSLARKFATLDLISGGRCGWNVVTSGNETEALNFSKQPHLPKVERYKRGREFVEVVQALWDSWDDDAFLRDKESGIFFDRSKMHVLDHHGQFYDIRGPLNVAALAAGAARHRAGRRVRGRPPAGGRNRGGHFLRP